MVAFPLLYVIFEIVMLFGVYKYDTPAYIYSKYGEKEAEFFLIFKLYK